MDLWFHSALNYLARQRVPSQKEKEFLSRRVCLYEIKKQKSIFKQSYKSKCSSAAASTLAVSPEMRCKWFPMKKNKSVLDKIRTHDLCDTGALLYQLSYQADWKLFTLWVRNTPVHGEDTSEYMKDHRFELRRKIWRHDNEIDYRSNYQSCLHEF